MTGVRRSIVVMTAMSAAGLRLMTMPLRAEMRSVRQSAASVAARGDVMAAVAEAAPSHAMPMIAGSASEVVAMVSASPVSPWVMAERRGEPSGMPAVHPRLLASPVAVGAMPVCGMAVAPVVISGGGMTAVVAMVMAMCGTVEIALPGMPSLTTMAMRKPRPVTAGHLSAAFSRSCVASLDAVVASPLVATRSFAVPVFAMATLVWSHVAM